MLSQHVAIHPMFAVNPQEALHVAITGKRVEFNNVDRSPHNFEEFAGKSPKIAFASRVELHFATLHWPNDDDAVGRV